MTHSEGEDFQLYLSRVRPIYHQLFNIAHAITGNCDLAEYSLQYALTDYWAASAVSHHGFREGLRNTLIHAAMRSMQNQAEFTWNGLSGDSEAAQDDTVRQMIGSESAELRRILALKYGCGLSLGRISRITGVEVRRIQSALGRFEARAKRRLDMNLRRRWESVVAQSIRADFNQASPLAPDMGNVFRNFEADAAAMSRPSRLPVRILQWILAVMLAIICIGGFWLAAILMQPPVLEEPIQIVEVQE